MPFEYFNNKYKDNDKTINKVELSSLVWLTTNDHDLSEGTQI